MLILHSYPEHPQRTGRNSWYQHGLSGCTHTLTLNVIPMGQQQMFQGLDALRTSCRPTNINALKARISVPEQDIFNLRYPWEVFMRLASSTSMHIYSRHLFCCKCQLNTAQNLTRYWRHLVTYAVKNKKNKSNKYKVVQTYLKKPRSIADSFIMMESSWL